MKKNCGIQKLVTLALLGIFTFSNMIPYPQFVQKNRQFEIRVQSQEKSNGLDVGKAD
ncbi:PhrA family quorum-sensing system peptide [Streptococcus ruminantium]|uniref:PhrA family quorum-sensing system peptide n=1 Tax=Streptococcus ruminantium TaxID=1917441 RepID=UPI0012DC84A5|nr:PhrA family quorum-sensing system peptide [Streptococcus ruminantium]